MKYLLIFFACLAFLAIICEVFFAPKSLRKHKEPPSLYDGKSVEDIALNLGQYIEKPEKDSSYFFLIVGDSTVKVVKYPDGCVKTSIVIYKDYNGNTTVGSGKLK